MLIESILQAHDQRTALVSQYQDAIASYKQNKDAKGYKNTKRNLDDRFRTYTEKIDSLSKELQEMDTERSFKVGHFPVQCLPNPPSTLCLTVNSIS